ncbi:MAG: hypothetical protein C7B47_14635 [Sulfobacillus thermosulfidooxidans]|uniref:HTH gntR-type domain-containing protein n=1 Tax=Sulfobacillus thermosulfidooxidans TaxID=28034 RepID=A0A2T2WQK3_SULTH|nr:MAG: hypothetical protein C7B47_14635 [Sulfobacillus thermosulfidooxidans]
MKSIVQRPIPIRDQAYETLKQAIFSGELAPGTIVTEREICEQLGISRTPAREALMRLELEGYVQFSPRQGAIVQNAPISSPEELFTLLGVLEGLAARWAASRRTPEQLKKLDSILNEWTGKTEQEVAKFHQEMINVILDMAQSDRLKHMLEPLHEYRNYMMAIGHLKTGRVIESAQEHKAIYNAIAEGNGAKAENLVRSHLQKSLNAFLEGMQQSSSSTTPLNG